MNKLPVIPDNQRPEFCGPCGGKCCQGMPGACMPTDFGATPDEVEVGLTEALSSGLYAVDWWEGDYEGASSPEYVRVAIKGHEGRLRHGAWGGVCAQLGPTGCGLTFERRPTQCRALVATGVGECEMPPGYSGKEPYIEAWLPYQGLIARALTVAERRRANFARDSYCD